MSADEHAATVRLTRATWALCLATAALILATVLLAVVTAAEKAEPAHHGTEEVAK
jgi:ABC-type enterochelin transport system permease subunit